TIENEVRRVRTIVERAYRDDIEHNAQSLEAILEVIHHDAPLRAALARRDRGALLQLAAPLYVELRRKFGITHFYFSDPDRVNLLRVHQQERSGDVIDRHTTLEAARTGTTFWGVELGPLGTFTLRLVRPWYATDSRQNLIGYVELGMEIDHVLETVQVFAGVPIFVLISKQYLRREDWEAGMRMLGRTPEWDRFPDAVLNTQASGTLPMALASRLTGGLPARTSVMGITQERADYRAIFLPMADASGRDVGRMVALIDVSWHLASSSWTLYLGSAIGVFIAVLLFGFFYRLVGRVGRRIDRDQDELKRLATHDGLTGLYNHRMFYSLLNGEFTRAQRFGRAVSLLMLDIDHFKRVNDSYGHLSGNAVLKALSDLLVRQARAIDHICRYGGEEITVILPETDLETAASIAERLRAAVEAQAFKVNGDAPLRITVSIGCASFPAQADNSQALVDAADAALYAAKQSGRNLVMTYESALAQTGAFR
ncbi:MAG: diguanylate cyclase, partial [Methylococcaceae bacterium]|nr:diguanylate cyclase [Methylococcaceae bacterium]